MKTVMVTGASGFVGAALCRELVQAGYSVVGVVRKVVEKIPLVTYLETDLVDTGAFIDHFPLVECVIHLAGRAHVLDERAEEPLTAFREANRDATIRLARRALNAGVKRFVFISSIGVNGNSTQGRPFTESSPPKPHADYAVSKLEAERELHALLKGESMELVIVRPPLIYAANAPGNFSRLLTLVSNGMPLPLASVHNARSLVSLQNVLSFLKLCIEHPAAAGELFLVADGQDVSTPEMVRSMAEGMGKRFSVVPFPVSFLRLGLAALGKSSLYEQLCGSLQVDAAKARRLLGWSPEESTRSGLEKAGRDFRFLRKNR
ncbi:NAD-dependent epimerase/dehydratase family protein [Pseudomonas taiwanensis]|uniref:NAD-dependent epimerase/dehydratase family protein n=1 Tax=Pseudomonas taiwanensis TaxID=470150 RepID=UPI001FD381B2|nr:NAD-dependent epimerase/dehydratase family protein [Pseudomonas taiwanensis]